MPYLSPALNVMIAAARKAGRALIRDFGELENLQISKKGPADFVGDRTQFLQDGMRVVVQLHEGKPLGISLPQQVVLEVVEADPVTRGQTAASSYKSATLENGLRVQVPPFIEKGTKVIVSTDDGSYVKRAE